MHGDPEDSVIAIYAWTEVADIFLWCVWIVYADDSFSFAEMSRIFCYSNKVFHLLQVYNLIHIYNETYWCTFL